MLRTPVYAAVCFYLLLAAASAFSIENPDPHRFDPEIERFLEWDRQNSVPQQAVLFTGSSSIRRWMTAEAFPDFPVINRGFGGSHISDVIYFADRILLPYRPAMVVFYAGDNDIAAGKSASQVLEDFQTLTRRIWETLPGTKIIFLPIKPSLARWNLWPEMQRANILVRNYTESDDRLLYADIATPMLDKNGQPDAGLFLEDGLHLNDRGYELWSRIVRPVIEKARMKK